MFVKGMVSACNTGNRAQRGGHDTVESTGIFARGTSSSSTPANTINRLTDIGENARDEHLAIETSISVLLTRGSARLIRKRMPVY